MEELSLSDIKDCRPEIIETEMMGKKAYLQKLSFEGAVGLPEQKTESHYLLSILAATLCNSEGALLFESIEAGMAELGKLPPKVIFDVFETVKSESGMDIEEELKNSEADQ